MEYALQWPFEVFAVEVGGGVDVVAGEADRLDDELRGDALGAFCEEKRCGEVEPAVGGEQVHVVQELLEL